jgi:hypothetical protein
MPVRIETLKLSLLVAGLICCSLLWADADFAGMEDNSWIRLPKTGGPTFGADVHCAIDTAGYMYMFGGCTYGNGAGNSHNNDVYRFNIKTGYVDRLSNCSSNTLNYRGGCQAGQTYDSNRNCVWLTSGFAPTCGSGRGGLLKYQCPDGPLTQVNSTGGGHLYTYDPVNDLIYCPVKWDLKIYDCQADSWETVSYPFWGGFENFEIPSTCDKKRGLFVITMCAPYSGGDPSQMLTDVWFYNGATGQWSSKTPAVHPDVFKQAMAYDARNDRYVYFGKGPDNANSEVWVYDYDSNTWVKMDRTGKAYNDVNQEASTWAPYSNAGGAAARYMTISGPIRITAITSRSGFTVCQTAACLQIPA